MNKTGLKTFVCSFVLTLSAILSADRAFFYTPKTEETIKIPRKNIALFFSRPHPQTYSSQIEPVHKVALKTPEFEPEELKIAQNVPTLPKELIVSNVSLLPEREEIPLQIETAPAISDAEPVADVPLIYAGVEKKSQSLGSAQKELPPPEAQEKPVQLAAAEKPAEEVDLLTTPMVIKATKQIIKIDNLKKRQERLQAQAEEKEKALETASVEESIPLQKFDEQPVQVTDKDEPPANQIASLSENISLPEAEEAVSAEAEEQPRQWQTMAEKHNDETPWVVARGSKYIKNKQLLKEDFASDAAQKKADGLIAAKKTDNAKTAKVAVQDNILIPIPRELLDEDDLVPDISNDKSRKAPPKPQKKEKDSSFLDSITSVFSKENREKAIKNIKAKSEKLLGTEEAHPPILPTEIRLSFQPNRAEISGQTLRWIQAFAKKAVDEKSVGLEIRIDGSKSFELQQKRLNLLYNILTANDVPYQKINTVFVDREPNSFVVRTVKIVSGREAQKEDDRWKKYYQKW